MNEDLCRTIRDDLGEWAREALLDGRTAEIEAHIAGCPVCRAEAERERALLVLLAQLPSPEPGAAFDAELASRLARQSAPGQRRVRPRRGLAVGGLAAVAAAAAALLVFTTDTGEHAGLPGADPAAAEEFVVARDLDLYQNLELIELLDVLPDLEAIEALPEEEPT